MERTKAEVEVVAAIAEVLQIFPEAVREDLETPLCDHLDSLDIVEVLMIVEDALNINVDDSKQEKLLAGNINSFVDYLVDNH